MGNPFVDFVKKYREENPKLSYKDAMKEASKVYKKGEKTEKTQKTTEKKSKKENIKMSIKEPKNVRAKKLRKYKKLKKNVEDDLTKKQIRPKEYNEYLVLAELLAGNSQKNSYARHLKMINRKLNTKALKPLKEKLDKSKKDSNELLNLLDKQKAENIKRTIKTQSKFNEEQNRENRYRRILGEKIAQFNKDPQNKGKPLPKAKFEREAEDEAEEITITQQIEGNLKKINGANKLVYATEFKKYKAKNPTATRSTFKPIYAQMKKSFDEKKTSTPTPTTQKITRTISVESVGEKKKPLTDLQNKNLKNRLDDYNNSTTKDAKGLFLSLGKPDKALARRYLKQLQTIQKKQPENKDIEKIIDTYEDLADNIDDIRSGLKPKKAPAPKSKAVISDTDTDTDVVSTPPSSPKPKPKTLRMNIRVKDKDGKAFLVNKKDYDAIVKKLNEEKDNNLYGKGKPNLMIALLRKDGVKDRTIDNEKLNAVIDDYENKRFGEVLTKPLESDSDDSDSSFDLSKLKEYSPTDEAEKFVEPLQKLVYDGVDKYGGQGSANWENAEKELKKSPAITTAFFTRTDSAKDRLETATDLYKAFYEDGTFSDMEKTMEVNEADGSDIDLTLKMNDLSSYYNSYLIVDIMAQYDGYDMDFNKIGDSKGGGFADMSGVEPINNIEDLGDAKGGALIDLIHKRLIKNNPKAKKKKSVDKEDEIFVKLSNQSYKKTDERKANLDGYDYNRAQSDEENAVYIDEKNKKIIIAFRGSKKLKDLKADLSIATGRLSATARHDNTEKLVQKIKALYPDYSITLTGHSLGGSLAISLSTKENIPAVVFNAGHTIGSQNDADIKYYTKMGDPVSMLGANSYKDVNVIEGSHKNPLKDHKLNNFEGGAILSGATLDEPVSGGSLVDKIKSKLMDYAKENTKVKKALLLKDIYKLVKSIKNEGFKKSMLKEIGHIALELNDLV